MKKRLIIASCFFLIALAAYFLGTQNTAEDKNHSVLDRVEETGTIRCGYWVYEPFVVRNLETDEMEGLTVDYLEGAAARLGKKIEWTAELGFDQIEPSLKYERVDAFCVPCIPGPDFVEHFDFSGGFGRLPYYLYGAKGLPVPKEKMDTARFAGIEGFYALAKTKELFPKGKLISLPTISPIAELYDQIRYGKVDFVFNEHVSAKNYMQHNPDVMERVPGDPLVEVELLFPTKKGDARWHKFFDSMTDTNIPENKAIFDALLKEHGLEGENAIFP